MLHVSGVNASLYRKQELEYSSSGKYRELSGMNDVPALNIKELHKTFGQNEVLKGISLEAHKGDVISIIGSSGSGKSTFLRCINLLETPTSGEIWVDGELIQMKKNRQGESSPANEKQVQRIRSRLAMVFSRIQPLVSYDSFRKCH